MSDRANDLARRIDAFLHEHVIPFEQDPRIGKHGPSDDLRIELQGKAAAQGLLAPHVGVEYGGHDTFSLRDARWRSIVNSEV
jgi:acyl-CoA dehydrogenase